MATCTAYGLDWRPDLPDPRDYAPTSEPATLLLRPFDSDTLAVVAYQLARDERLSEAALPSLAIVVVGLIPVLMLSRAIRAKR